MSRCNYSPCAWFGMLRTSAGMQSLYIYDGTGSPIALVNHDSTTVATMSYDPYGVAVGNDPTGGRAVPQNPYTYVGGLQDRTTGWIKYGQRWYDPAAGRFTQQVTLDAPLDHGNANRYAYPGGDPINHQDPTGFSYLGAAVGIVFGWATTITGAGAISLATGGLAPPPAPSSANLRRFS